ncbi:hypothetical protein PISMIDRAFT_689005 [Pisolithus microcarpus 441]|uniref:Unplaced genomic scaffold scaffold_338, whole genome shotgun sequence n=1 Tax=Pisolithus microcarpus 441 TaxID=765257 RepID=A0A0C9YS11_9AGAM|nr:hypothetical protein BKA83DRAFT_689005 [Pisolithus microcarpus]KIK13082.1 hypothetical protein PISMIDRAFT_689005 [Pisolithus microcarpus 441]
MSYCHISSDIKDCEIRLWDSGWEFEDVCIILAEHGSCEWPAPMPNAIDVQHVEGMPSLGMSLFEASSILYMQY